MSGCIFSYHLRTSLGCTVEGCIPRERTLRLVVRGIPGWRRWSIVGIPLVKWSVMARRYTIDKVKSLDEVPPLGCITTYFAERIGKVLSRWQGGVIFALHFIALTRRAVTIIALAGKLSGGGDCYLIRVKKKTKFPALKWWLSLLISLRLLDCIVFAIAHNIVKQHRHFHVLACHSRHSTVRRIQGLYSISVLDLGHIRW